MAAKQKHTIYVSPENVASLTDAATAEDRSIGYLLNRAWEHWSTVEPTAAIPTDVHEAALATIASLRAQLAQSDEATRVYLGRLDRLDRILNERHALRTIVSAYREAIVLVTGLEDTATDAELVLAMAGRAERATALERDLERVNALYDGARGRELCLRVNITEALGIDDPVSDEELYEAAKAVTTSVLDGDLARNALSNRLCAFRFAAALLVDLEVDDTDEKLLNALGVFTQEQEAALEQRNAELRALRMEVDELRSSLAAAVREPSPGDTDERPPVFTSDFVSSLVGRLERTVEESDARRAAKSDDLRAKINNLGKRRNGR